MRALEIRVIVMKKPRTERVSAPDDKRVSSRIDTGGTLLLAKTTLPPLTFGGSMV